MKDFLPGYVRTLADLMGLREWEFQVEDGTSDEDVATINLTQWQQHAVITIMPCFWLKPPDIQRWVVTHELVHSHVSPVRAVLDEDIASAKVLSQQVYEMAYASLTRIVEHAVNAIAAAWAKSLPLPPEEVKDAESILPH